MPVAHVRSNEEVEIYYEEWGAGEPLVLIGGLSSTLELWERNVPELAEHFRVVAPDNRGTGRTHLPNDQGLRSPGHFADDMLALIDHLGFERVHLTGASMGSFWVQEFAFRYPERLQTLSLFCGHGGAGGPSVDVPPDILAALIKGTTPGATPEEERAGVVPIFHPGTVSDHPELIDRYIELKRKWTPTAEELARRTDQADGWSSYDRLRELAVPTFVITGAVDYLNPPKNSEVLSSLIPDSELVILEKGGHLFFQECVEETHERWIRFMTRTH
jgi:pimeloyl-ACP methyl ester carboxylesterase